MFSKHNHGVKSDHRCNVVEIDNIPIEGMNKR